MILMVLCIVATGCTPDDELPLDPLVDSEDPGASAGAPEIPVAGESAAPQPGASDDPVVPPTPRPRAGRFVLVDLEGASTDRDATDVVLRTERGLELDRFRLPGAIGLFAEPGGRWALIRTLDGQWAKLDGVAGTLSLVSFAEDAPTTPPRLQGPIAYWTDSETPWLLRLDGGDPTDLRGLVGGEVQVDTVSADGQYVLLRGDGTFLLDTISLESRRPDPDSRLTLGVDGTVATVFARDGTAVLTVERADGGDRRDLAELAALGLPVPLPDGRVLVIGGTSTVVSADGSRTDLPDIPSPAGTPVVLGLGGTVVLPVAAGLAVINTNTSTVDVIADSQGFTLAAEPLASWGWAASDDPDAPGLIVINGGDGTATRLLVDVPTGPVTSMSTDGFRVVVASGEGVLAVSADGIVLPPAPGAVISAVMHPTDPLAAATVVDGALSTLQVGELGGPVIEIAGGRNPAWLKTGT
ncbi:MAG: hypothetical protein ACR2HR_13310 [Euzebya sp.]